MILTEEDKAEDEIEEAIISIPLIIENNTISDQYYISTNGDTYQFESKSNGKAYENYEEPKIEGARSIYTYWYTGNKSIFYIKNDNSLWGYGWNRQGQLGDNTGVDREEPIKITDDVANVYIHKQGFEQDSIFAVKMDKTLWYWGGKIGSKEYEYAPVKLLDDVVSLLQNNRYLDRNYTPIYYALTSDGSLWTWDSHFYHNGMEGSSTPTKVISGIKDFKIVGTRSGIDYYIIKGDDTLWTWSVSGLGELYVETKETELTKILDDVAIMDAVNGSYGATAFALKKMVHYGVGAVMETAC